MRARISRLSGARLGALVLCLAVVVAAGLQLVDVNPAVSQSTTVEALRTDEAPDLDPDNSIWGEAPQVSVPLASQRVNYPFGGGSLPAVRVQALHDGRTLFVRVTWRDTSVDTRTVGSDDFSDAVAVQFPSEAGSTAPAICMGQADGGVNIWHWRADSERGLPETIKDLRANGYVDMYPSTDDLYYPAREAGNPYAQPGRGPVQDLVAIGFGTLGPAASQTVAGSGRFDDDDDEWSVVFRRPFRSADDKRPDFAVGEKTDMALAAWNGRDEDRNGQKSVSPFVRLSISTTLAAPQGSDLGLVVVAGATVGVVFALVLGGSYFFDPSRRRSS